MSRNSSAVEGRRESGWNPSGEGTVYNNSAFSGPSHGMRALLQCQGSAGQMLHPDLEGRIDETAVNCSRARPGCTGKGPGHHGLCTLTACQLRWHRTKGVGFNSFIFCLAVASSLSLLPPPL